MTVAHLIARAAETAGCLLAMLVAAAAAVSLWDRLATRPGRRRRP